MNKQENVQFKLQAAPLETGSMYERVKDAGTVERVVARFYKGQESALKVRPIIRKKGNVVLDLITYVGTETMLSGEDDTFTFDVSIPVSNDDEIGVVYSNTDAVFTYTVMAIISVDYYGGEKRVVR